MLAHKIERREGGGGGGAREGYSRLGCEVSQLNLTSTVVQYIGTYLLDLLTSRAQRARSAVLYLACTLPCTRSIQ